MHVISTKLCIESHSNVLQHSDYRFRPKKSLFQKTRLNPDFSIFKGKFCSVIFLILSFRLSQRTPCPNIERFHLWNEGALSNKTFKWIEAPYFAYSGASNTKLGSLKLWLIKALRLGYAIFTDFYQSIYINHSKFLFEYGSFLLLVYLQLAKTEQRCIENVTTVIGRLCVMMDNHTHTHTSFKTKSSEVSRWPPT